MDVNDIPVKRAAVRTGLLARVLDPNTDILPEEFNAVVDALKNGTFGVGPFAMKFNARLTTHATDHREVAMMDGNFSDGTGSGNEGSPYVMALHAQLAYARLYVPENDADTETVVVLATVDPDTGVPTPTDVIVTVPAGTTGRFSFDSQTHTFGAGDLFAVFASNDGGGTSNHFTGSVMLGFNPLSPIDPDAADATTSEHGLMSAADKTKLNGLDVGARLKVAADFTLDPAVGLYLVDTSAGDLVATLPGTIEHGWTIKKITTDTHKITLAPTGTDHIEGTNASLDLPNSGDPVRGAWRVDGSLQTGALGWWVE